MKYKDKKFLRDKYVAERLTLEQIADICDTNKEVVRYWVKKHKIHRDRLPKKTQRRRNKRAALDYLNNRCCVCGYNKCENALQFHHVHPEDKKFTVSSALGSPWKKIKQEIDKCVLVCSNCHIEIHSGLVKQAQIEEIYIAFKKEKNQK